MKIVSSLENGTMATGGPEGTGFGLSQRGKLQVSDSAKSLSEYILASLRPGYDVKIRVLTSPFRRTRQTADIVNKELRTAIDTYNQSVLTPHHEKLANITIEGEEPEQIMDLRERFFGEFEMKTPSDDLYETVWREDAFNSFHNKFGVESVAEVTKRMTGLIRDHELKEVEDNHGNAWMEWGPTSSTRTLRHC
ncbi:hypothetical protein BGX27_010117 [Mortierella sp. AM989]|nr:hypothetical protein BGX27_010117 [Mortierella sp. AM989]